MQNRPSTGPGIVEQHRGLVPLYLSVMVSEWALLYFVWVGGLRRTGTPLRGLIGGKWATPKDVLLDAGVAVGFWIVVEMALWAVKFALGPDSAKSIEVLLPQGPLEISIWVALSLTAGFCEEVVFRGYLQKQFLALTGSATFAVLLQAVVFGVSHGYQGMRQVVVISVYGLLYGLLAQWRHSLRPGMIQHAGEDIFSGIVVRLLAATR